MSKLPRILHIIAGLDIGGQAGGAESFALRLAGCLQQDAFEVGIFIMWRAGTESEAAWLEKLAQAKIPIFGMLEQQENRAGFWRVYRSLWKAVSQWKPHILHSHSERGDFFNLALRTFHPRHPKAVRTVHIDQQWRTNPWIGTPFQQLATPVLFSAETAVSATTARYIDQRPLARWRDKRAAIVYNGIDEALLTTEFPARNQVHPVHPESKARVAVIGRLSEQKGHKHLFRALAQFPFAQRPNVQLIGSGPLEASLKALRQELGLNDAIEFMGQREDALSLLAQADLLVLPSLWEGFPTVVLEAMALGVPVLATDVSGTGELVKNGETGYLVPPGEVDELKRTLQKALAEPVERAALAARAREAVRPYTIQSAARKMGEIYRNI